ncbi:Ig-like domain-containing protein [Marinobacter nauticus]|uniref:Ig-like domain-containing protein n=1 Tax=Marinobacter nauticus TaxID=2743 RepID=A0A368UQB2_MARNT|nr:Ig-like domain-containing protein [Marinobacter nauticus]RBP69460.1 Ig-like domain-containing protein [Marinobacter nauticus]RCW31028.1 Ig-like domain-containing protein [Marinobacter nauticus]
MKKTTIALIVTTALAGCGGSGDKQTVTRAPTPGSLTFTYPADSTSPGGDQPGVTSTVPTTAPVFLRFNKSIDTPLTDLPDVLVLKDATGNEVTLTDVMFTGEDKMGLAAKPDKALAPGTSYTLTAEGLQVGGAPVSLTADGIKFKTAPATSGPLLSQTEGTGFELARTIPDGGSDYPVTDFTTFRLQFTEPVDPQSVVYGQTIRLTDQAGEPVNAEVYVKGHRVTVDPEGYLDPARTYNLTVTSGIKSALLGDALSEDHTLTFNPIDSRSPTGKRQIMAQVAESIPGQLPLTGADYNSVNLSSLLLGEENPTSVTGTVFAELGFIPKFEAAGQSIPLRIDRGTLLTGSSVVVKVAGAVPAGFESDAVEVRFLSDANGFLMPNPYTDAVDAPRMLELYIDMALNTGNTVANGALGQQLMHVQLVGTALVEDGKLSIEAVGVIEPDVMGIDTASGLISFKLNGFRNVDDAPLQADFADTEAPFIKSWVPGDDNQDKLRPGDNLVVYFNEPLLPSSINSDNIQLEKGGVPVDVNLEADGGSIVIDPVEPLEHGPGYVLRLNPNGASSENHAGLRDLSGNTFASQAELPFRLSPTEPGTPADQSPLALITHPGYPCAKTDIDINAGNQGRCAGGKADDNLLPIGQLETDKPIIVRFSQNMDPQTIVPGTSLTIERQADSGSWEEIATSEYTLTTGPRSLTITPLVPWETGSLYRYTLNASDSAIKSAAGLPLQTVLLTQGKWDASHRSSGGNELVNYFTGIGKKHATYLPLRNLPATDANADLDYSKDVEAGSSTGETVANAVGLASNGVESLVPPEQDSLVVDANIGCGFATEGDGSRESCPEDKFIYLTAMLDTFVAGTPDDQGRVPVEILPSVLASTSSDVWVKIDTALLDAFAAIGLADTGIEAEERIPTGPLMLRIGYPGDTDGNIEPLTGFLYTNDEGQLSFELLLDVLLDAPYLNPSIGPANLDHNLYSYPIQDQDGEHLTLRGPVTFFQDGRIQIELTNPNKVLIDVEVRGDITLTADNVEGICGLIPDLCNPIIDLLGLNADTVIHLEIPEDKLSLTYLSPTTQQ